MKRSWAEVPTWRRALALVTNALRLVLLNGLFVAAELELVCAILLKRTPWGKIANGTRPS